MSRQLDREQLQHARPDTQPRAKKQNGSLQSAAEFAAPNAANLNRIPDYGTARSLRQTSVMAMQMQRGNGFVSRMVASNRAAQSDETALDIHQNSAERIQRTPDPRTLPPEMRTFWQRWGAQIKLLKRMFNEQRYGCWCGPGHVCEETQDDIDKCCKAHDMAYERAGVTSASPPPPGQAGMWSIEGFRRTMAADAALVVCVNATAFDLHFYGPSAALYRAGVNLIFGPRAAIGAAANLIAALASIPPEWLLMDLTDMESLLTLAANDVDPSDDSGLGGDSSGDDSTVAVNSNSGGDNSVDDQAA